MHNPHNGALPHVRVTTHTGHRTYVPVWLRPHPNGRPGSYQVPTMGATHARNHPTQRNA